MAFWKRKPPKIRAEEHRTVRIYAESDGRVMLSFFITDLYGSTADHANLHEVRDGDGKIVAFVVPAFRDLILNALNADDTTETP